MGYRPELIQVQIKFRWMANEIGKQDTYTDTPLYNFGANPPSIMRVIISQLREKWADVLYGLVHPTYVDQI